MKESLFKTIRLHVINGIFDCAYISRRDSKASICYFFNCPKRNKSDSGQIFGCNLRRFCVITDNLILHSVPTRNVFYQNELFSWPKWRQFSDGASPTEDGWVVRKLAMVSEESVLHLYKLIATIHFYNF